MMSFVAKSTVYTKLSFVYTHNMRKEIFLSNHFYHVYNRGVDKRTIFLNERDYERFYTGICLLNDARVHDYNFSQINLRSLASCPLSDRDLLVDILHWCLMPNHFHLFLRQRKENGIRIFMHKLGTSYTKFFNKKYERSGRLFEGSFKARYIEKDDYFSHLGAYIATNHLELFKPGWKDGGVQRNEISACKKFLIEYKWSSFRDYFGRSLIANVVSPSIFYEVFDCSRADFDKVVTEYLQFKHEAFKHEA